MMSIKQSAWIVSARFDTGFILAPAILTAIAALGCSSRIITLDEMPGWLWLVLIVGIDAGHVYATLFRTYFDKVVLKGSSTLLTMIPLLTWLTGCLLYSIDSMIFWRALAYLALFHFIRQQYGFMMIYGRNERDLPSYNRLIDKAAIYLATVYPVIYWHCHARVFNWFVEDDFILIDNVMLSVIAQRVYMGVMLLYLVKEIKLLFARKTINIARNLVLFGTGLSWYTGIVEFNNDLIFTATNVIAHGIPYYALIWAYGYKQTLAGGARSPYTLNWLNKLFNWKAIPLYVTLLFGLAYFEEGLWDGLIWREHTGLFRLFDSLPAMNSEQTLAWLAPLLALPQATHYLLDAFIWREHYTGANWRKILFYEGKPGQASEAG